MRKAWDWIVGRIGHKLQHLHPSKLLDILKEHGVALVIIIVGWELIEDVVFPLLFIWLGKNVDPWWLTGAPISWILCLHPIAVPVLWTAYIKLSGKKDDPTKTPPDVCCDTKNESQD
tara:strand:+ start:8525 stop:8875 length:351 start_codon:yes stop_codon:yes gene_type:complete